MIRKVVSPVTRQPANSQIALAGIEKLYRNRFTSKESPRPSRDAGNLVAERLGESFYKYALYYGCGTGELIPDVLGPRCGHIWAMDMLPEALEVAKKRAPHVSTRKIKWPVWITGPRGKIDLLVVSQAFQYITDDPLLAEMVQHLALWLKPGARVILLDNAVDRAVYLRPRDPLMFAHGFDLRPGWYSSRVKVDDRDHWILDGTRL